MVSLSLFIAICDIIDGGDGVRAMKHPRKDNYFFLLKVCVCIVIKKTKSLPQVLSP